MKYKKWILACALFEIAIAGIVFILFIKDDVNKVEFQDDEMKKIIALEAYKDGLIKNTDEFSKEHLEKVKDINIGYTGYYNTLTDITLCTNLESLIIGAVNGGHKYHKASYEIPRPESKERILEIQDELSEILQGCNKLEVLYIWNTENTCDLQDLDFLEYGTSLKVLWIDELTLNDYSPIFECEELQFLYIEDCNISSLKGVECLEQLEDVYIPGTDIATADDIIKIPNLKSLKIVNTPLAENEEELARIYEVFPAIEIIK